MNRIAIVLACALMAAWLGCGRSKTYTAPDGSQVTVNERGGENTITFKGKEGETVQIGGGKDVPLPAGFPTNLVYPGAKVTTTLKNNEAASVTYSSPDPLAKVIGFYEQKLKADGWEIQQTANTGDFGMVSAKKEKQTCMAAASKSSGETNITITLSAEK